MRKRWVIGGVGLLVAAGIATALLMRSHGVEWSAVPGVQALAKGAVEGKGDKPATLEFTAAEVVQPVMATMPLTIEFSGPLVAPGTAVVRAKAVGTLLSLNVNEGSRVKAGQVLGIVDLAELSSRVAERNAMLASARAQLAQAERTHQSNLTLADQKFISPIALENSRAALEAARAQMLAAQAQLNTSSVSLRDAALVAPIPGLVAKRHVVPGEKLTPEEAVLTIVDLAKLELAGTVGTHEVSLLTPGMPVQVRVEGVAKAVTGTVARIAPAAEAGTRSIGVTIELSNPKEIYRAGQYALAKVVLPDSTQRMTLPVAAIDNDAGQERVWVIENGLLMRRAVTTGRRDGASSRVEVLRGLSSGAQVLAARFDNLREGSRAVVVAKTPAGSGSGPAVVASAAASAAAMK
jgi:RND family efflux transporter MFP subunit